MDLGFDKMGMSLDESDFLYSIPPSPVLHRNCFKFDQDHRFKTCDRKTFSLSTFFYESANAGKFEDGNYFYDGTNQVNLDCQKNQVQLIFNGKQWSNKQEVTLPSFLKRQESSMSTLTAFSNLVSLNTGDSQIRQSLKVSLTNVNETSEKASNFNHIQEIKVDKQERRMVSFVLAKFNSFAWTSPLQEKTDNCTSNDCSKRKVSKKISKNCGAANAKVRKQRKNKLKADTKSIGDSTSCAISFSRGATVQEEHDIELFNNSNLLSGEKLDLSVHGAKTMEELPA